MPADLPPDFHPFIYKSIHSDLQHLSDAAATQHFKRNGRREGRSWSIPMPFGFNPQVYRSMYPDLAHLSLKDVSMHFWNHGHYEGRSYSNLPPDVINRYYTPGTTLLEEVEGHKHISRGLDAVRTPRDLLRYHEYYIKLPHDDLLPTLYPQFYPPRRKPITVVIYTPKLDMSVGGFVALHNLAKVINDVNHPDVEARLFYLNSGPSQNQFCNEFISVSDILQHPESTVVVYPEADAFKYNPLGARKVIRWILAELGVNCSSSITQTWNLQSDKILYWDEGFQRIVPDPGNSLLTIPYLNPIVLSPHQEGSWIPTMERTQTCYLVRKGSKYLNDNQRTQIMREWNAGPECISLDGKGIDEILGIFRRCKVFYCFDPDTMYTIFAPLCGCVTIQTPLLGKNEEEFFSTRRFYHDPIQKVVFREGIVYGTPARDGQVFQQRLQEAVLSVSRQEEIRSGYLQLFQNHSLFGVENLIRMITSWV